PGGGGCCSADPPPVAVPMAAGREVAILAEEAVGAPGDDARRAARDAETASGAHVLLDGGCGTLRLHVPQPVAARLGVLHPAEDALHIERLGFRVAAT